MTDHPSLTKDTNPMAAPHPVPPSGEGDALWYAKAALADFENHDDATLLEACQTVITQDTDPSTIANARERQAIIEEETTCQMAGG